MADDPRILVVGAGLFGRRHLEAIDRTPGVRAAGVMDPRPAGRLTRPPAA